MNQFIQKNTSLVKIVIISIYFTFLFIPGYFFFTARGGFEFLLSASSKNIVARIFPLFGLYAFFFVWAQLLIGSSMNILTRVFPKLLNFHRTQGIFALFLALTHPILVYFVYSATYLGFKFLPTDLQIYGYFGLTAVSLMLLTVLSALLRRSKLLRKHWRKVHILNYLVFILIWLHSWNLGSDVQSSNLRFLWYFYGITVVISTGLRIYLVLTKPKYVPSKPPQVNV